MVALRLSRAAPEDAESAVRTDLGRTTAQQAKNPTSKHKVRWELFENKAHMVLRRGIHSR